MLWTVLWTVLWTPTKLRRFLRRPTLCVDRLAHLAHCGCAPCPSLAGRSKRDQCAGRHTQVAHTHPSFSHPSRSHRSPIQPFISSIPPPPPPISLLGEQVDAADVGADGVCSKSLIKLRAAEVTAEERSTLTSSVMRLIGSKQRCDEFGHFALWIGQEAAAQGPLEYVIDGANIGFYGQGKDMSALKKGKGVGGKTFSAQGGLGGVGAR